MKSALERVLGSRELFDAPVLVMANKQDELGAMTAGDVQESLGLGKMDARPTRVQPISALRGEGITEGVQWLITEIHRSSRAARMRLRAARIQ